MKALLLTLMFFTGAGSLQAQECSKQCMKYCGKHCIKEKQCMKYCQVNCDMTCTEGTTCCMQTTAFKSATASVPDTCHTFGRMNSHMGMMRVHRFYCLDSINFSVRSMRDMPYDCMSNDSMWFEVCLHRRDGKLYSTQVRAVTSVGEQSWDISMQAPASSDVKINEPQRERVVIYPNPASGSIRIPLDNEAIVPTSVQIIDMQGRTIELHVNVSGSEAIIPTTGLASGTYHLILKAGDVVYGDSDFILVR